jgi:predicted dehydrogenase
MFTIAGSGFGLYGYLPALVDAGEEVVLPAAYRAKVEARPELAAYAPGVRWAADADAALEGADAIVIATPPARQLELALRCLALPSLGTLLLEKPVAPTPREAIALLDALRRAGKRYRVGYTLLHAAWAWSGPWRRTSSRMRAPAAAFHAATSDGMRRRRSP